MNTVLIALNTFQEALRRRVLNVIVIFGMVAIGASNFFSYMSTGTEQKFLTDFGLGAILLFGMLMAVFLGASLIPAEIERKTIFTILAKPVDRLEFILGKFLGTAITVLANLALMGVVFLIAYYLKQRDIEKNIWLSMGNLTKALLLIYLELVLLASIAVTVSIIASTAFNLVFTFFIYFAGQMHESIKHIAEHQETVWGASVLEVLYFFIPKLSNFDVRNRILMENPVEWTYILKATGTGLIYIVVTILLGYLFFYDREF